MEWKAPDFKLSPVVAKTLDLSGAQSQIPSKVLLIDDICLHFKCAIQDIGILEMDETLDPGRAQSQIPLKVLLINDIRSHFKCAIQDI